MAFSFLGIAVIWIIDHQHALLWQSITHKRLSSKKDGWSLQRAHVMPKQCAWPLGAWRRSDRPQEMEERVPGHPLEAVGMSWSLVCLGRIFLTPNGAIDVGYTIKLDAAPSEKWYLLKPSSVRKVSSAEGFFWFSSAEKQPATAHMQTCLLPSLLLLSKHGRGQGRDCKTTAR